jgi:predicted N-acetyltransferase YhbS
MSKILAPEPIQDYHHVNFFCSGETSLDDWLRQRALKNEILGASRTFVACTEKGGVNKVVGFYALAAGSIAHSQVSSKAKRNMPNPIPVLVLGRLAVDNQWQGHGLGASLLQDAVLRSKAAAEHIGARALLVHALSEDAKRFYKHFGFQASPVDERTLMLLLNFK